MRDLFLFFIFCNSIVTSMGEGGLNPDAVQESLFFVEVGHSECRS